MQIRTKFCRKNKANCWRTRDKHLQEKNHGQIYHRNMRIKST